MCERAMHGSPNPRQRSKLLSAYVAAVTLDVEQAVLVVLILSQLDVAMVIHRHVATVVRLQCNAIAVLLLHAGTGTMTAATTKETKPTNLVLSQSTHTRCNPPQPLAPKVTP